MTLTYTKTSANLTKLTSELSQVSGMTSLSHYEDQLKVTYAHDLSQDEQNTAADIVTDHNPVNTPAVIGATISRAMDFGRQIMIEFGTENVMLG